MSGWMRRLAFMGCLGMAAAAIAAQPAGFFSDETDADLYDCAVRVVPAQKLPQTSAVALTLEWGADGECTLVRLTPKQIAIESVRKGRKTLAGRCDAGVKPGTPYELTVMRRGAFLGVLLGDEVAFRGKVPHSRGEQAGVSASRGWTVESAQVQRLEPVAFADNFMRTAEEPGQWAAQSGWWALRSAWDADPKGNGGRFNNVIYSQNPFAWVGSAADGAAWCTTGKPFWEDYTMTAAVLPPPGGAVGLAVNMADASNGMLVRWSAANGPAPRGNMLEVYRVADGRQTLLARDAGGYVPGQWYKMAVTSSLEGLSVAIDGRERISVPRARPWRGGVGLYAEGAAGAVFDDITVYGSTLGKDLLAESEQVLINQRFTIDRNGMQEWAAPQSDWVRAAAAPNQWLHRMEFYGDHWMSLSLRPAAITTGRLWMALNTDGQDVTTGYRACIEHSPEKGQTVYTLYRGAKELASASAKPLAAGVDYSFRFWDIGNALWLEQDEEKVLEATDSHTLAGVRPAYSAEGCFAAVRDALVVGRNLLDYTFANAPVDWLSEGAWAESVRWACAPNWSFLGGWSRGDAVLWHKQRFAGDHSLEAFVGLKMEYPRERDIYDNRYRDFGITICGDGADPRTGYTGIYGAPDKNGTPNQRTVLLRNGVEVGSAQVSVPGRGAAHREWFGLELRKHRDTVELWVEGKQAITFRDPDPIPAGVPAIWTRDNGINVARARIAFTNPPRLRAEPRVIMDEPWYPEWANVGRDLTLDFPGSWSTSGKSVSLQMTPHAVPPEDHDAVSINERRATFIPKAPGEHWYELCATDGERRSPGFHLFLPVFDPALGRDDARTVLLYRFDEGDGATVHDRSAQGSPLDLSIVDPTWRRWLPGQGITLRGPAPLTTMTAAKKLTALAQSKQATIELWTSTDTIYPPGGWRACLLAWELAENQRNLAVGHQMGSLLLAPPGLPITTQGGNLAAGGFRTGLQHCVITWDGTTTRAYINSRLVGSGALSWAPERWADAPLFVGNQADLKLPYLGTLYVLAVHDRCLSEAQIRRHYNAGPSAR